VQNRIAKRQRMEHRTILCVGDSITQWSKPARRLQARAEGPPGWGDRLQAYFDRRADVVNRGYSGYNTRAVVELVLPTLLPVPPTVVAAVVWLGANDACDPARNAMELHVPVDEFEANLAVIVSALCAPATVLVTPPPIDRAKLAVFLRQYIKGASEPTDEIVDRSTERASLYAAAVRRVASRLPNVAVADAFECMRADPARYLDDGLHLSGDGDALAFALIRDAIVALRPELEVTPDPITQSFSNSGSSSASLPALPFYDKWTPAMTLKPAPPLARLRPSLVCFGDSITQFAFSSPAWMAGTSGPGWGDLVSASLVRRADVWNRGLSGYNSRLGLAAMTAAWASSAPVELVTIFFGANDAASEALNPAQHVPLGEFQANIAAMVRRARDEWSAKRVLVIGCPPVDRTKYLVWRRSRTFNAGKPDTEIEDRTLAVACQYALAAKAAAAETGAGFVDVFSAFVERQSAWASLLSDGLHLSGNGNAAVAALVLDWMRANGLDVAPGPAGDFGALGSTASSLKPDLPWFEDVPEALRAAAAKAKAKRARTRRDVGGQ